MSSAAVASKDVNYQRQLGRGTYNFGVELGSDDSVSMFIVYQGVPLCLSVRIFVSLCLYVRIDSLLAWRLAFFRSTFFCYLWIGTFWSWELWRGQRAAVLYIMIVFGHMQQLLAKNIYIPWFLVTDSGKWLATSLDWSNAKFIRLNFCHQHWLFFNSVCIWAYLLEV